MTGALLFLGIGAFMLFVGFMSIVPEPDRSFRPPEGLARGEEMAGYLVIAAGGFCLATGVTGLLVAWLGDADDPPIGAIVMFVGASATWAMVYDRLYRRLRRPEPASRLARFVRTVGRTSGKAGPVLFAAGVILTAVL